MSERSKEVTNEEIESHVSLILEEAPTASLGATGNAFKNVFFTMMAQMFDKFMENPQAPQPQ
ncbi:hypothetical protein J1N35_033699 [Gossypium stocksii]|uniref:Uncharacterized protein n=1 Tax=Gossypium stocksii TaxID=47602 RepID=A0A9D3URH8_9ROSI|nr:hypothetical protein J1N35_033699 [Gossypium stocksii]